MAKATITHNHGFLEDCYDASAYGEHRTNMTDPQTSLAVLYDDYFVLEGVCDSADDEEVHYSKDITPFNTSAFPKFFVRWKTSQAGNGLGARVYLGFAEGGGQWILGETQPQFNTSWTVTSGTLTAAKTVDSIAFYADDWPNSQATGTSQTYYDFVLICQENFEFPNISEAVRTSGGNLYADIAIPGRVGEIVQYMGAELEQIQIIGDMSLGTWSETDLLEILHKASSEPWQWFSCSKPQRNYKVTFRSFPENIQGKPKYIVNLKEYRRSDAVHETYSERFGIT